MHYYELFKCQQIAACPAIQPEDHAEQTSVAVESPHGAADWLLPTLTGIAEKKETMERKNGTE